MRSLYYTQICDNVGSHFVSISEFEPLNLYVVGGTNYSNSSNRLKELQTEVNTINWLFKAWVVIKEKAFAFKRLTDLLNV